ISESFTFIISILVLSSKFSVKFESKIVRVSVKFGLPLIFGSLAMMLLNLSDRFLIKIFLNDEMVGLYDLGYRFAGILNMFIIMPISLTLLPYAYKIFSKKGDKEFFSKLLLYMTILLVFTGLGLSIFSKEIIKIFALNASYWPAYQITPIITFAYVLFGMRLVTSLGLYLTRQTKYVAITTVFVAILNIALNIIFIPKYGMLAAAYSTLISFAVLYLLSEYYSNRFYQISYDHKRILIVISLGIVFYFVSIAFNEFNLYIRIITKSLSILLFILALFLTNCINNNEIVKAKNILINLKSFVTKPNQGS
ncbi:MAG: polysaccharide biosynthesis C-terminal domain-containing protein, partial [Ignavibacterium sp.]